MSMTSTTGTTEILKAHAGDEETVRGQVEAAMRESQPGLSAIDRHWLLKSVIREMEQSLVVLRRLAEPYGIPAPIPAARIPREE